MPTARSTKLRPRQIRAALALKGHTPRSWAFANGYDRQLDTIYAVMNGKRSGAKSPAIVRALEALNG